MLLVENVLTLECVINSILTLGLMEVTCCPLTCFYPLKSFAEQRNADPKISQPINNCGIHMSSLETNCHTPS